MQVSVYIFVEVEKGEPWQVASELTKIDGVKTVHTVTGQYDIILFAEFQGIETLRDFVKRIHKIEGVLRTQTAVCML